MTAGPGRGWVLDTPAVHHALTGRSHYPAALLAAASARGQVAAIPAPALALAAGHIDDPVRRGIAVSALLQVVAVVIEPVTAHDAPLLGDLLGNARPELSGLEFDAAAVALCAARRGWPILSNRAAVLRALNPALDIRALP